MSVLAVLLLTLSSATNAAVGVTFTVNSTGDLADANTPSGPWDGVCATATASCTLRAAIQESNQSVGFQDTIAFAIPAAPIQPTTELPLITDSVVIDGTTHPDFVDEPLVGAQWGPTADESSAITARAMQCARIVSLFATASLTLVIDTDASHRSRSEFRC